MSLASVALESAAAEEDIAAGTAKSGQTLDYAEARNLNSWPNSYGAPGLYPRVPFAPKSPMQAILSFLGLASGAAAEAPPVSNVSKHKHSGARPPVAASVASPARIGDDVDNRPAAKFATDDGDFVCVRKEVRPDFHISSGSTLRLLWRTAAFPCRIAHKPPFSHFRQMMRFSPWLILPASRRLALGSASSVTVRT